MPFLCCGSNAAVVENTKGAAPVSNDSQAVKTVEESAPREEIKEVSPPPEPVEETKPAETDAITNDDETKLKEDAATPPPGESAPEEEIIFTKEEGNEAGEIKQEAATEDELMLKDAAESQHAEAEETKEPEPEESKEPEPELEPFLSSILGPTLMRGNDIVDTEEELVNSALVGVYYAVQNPPNLTKRLEVFAAGYEPKSLDVVYCPADDTVPKKVPESWLSLPEGFDELKSQLQEKLAIDDSNPHFVVVNPMSRTIISKSAFEQITNLDPFADDYDEQATKVFQDWIKELPMEQEVVREIEIMVEE